MWISARTSFLLASLAVGGRMHNVAGTREDLEKVHFGGRWWRSGEGMKHSWGVGTFVVRFRGSSRLAVEMQSGTNADGGMYYTCRIDDGAETKLRHRNGDGRSLTIATGLDPSSEHSARCGRNNEASWGATTVYGVLLDSSGELLQSSDPNEDGSMLRLEFIGDSITAGFKVTASSAYDPATVANQDVFLAYGHLLAESWKTSDYQVIAKSGVSILDYGTTGIPMPLEWPCREFWDSWQGSCPSLWDDSSWQADVVLINLGTNDFAFGDPTQEQFREGYLAFILDIRARFPNALIACIEPLQHSCGGEGYPVLIGIVNGIAQAVSDANDEKIIYYPTGSTSDQWLDCSLNTVDYVDFTHPTVEGNRKFAAKLYDAMNGDVCRFFPDKCGGKVPTPNPAPTSKPASDRPTSGPPVTLSTPTPPPASVFVSCRAVEQSELPEGSWATTDEQCSNCEVGYEWWPCDAQEPQLCLCTAINESPRPSSSPPSFPPSSGPPSASPDLVPSTAPNSTGSTPTLKPASSWPMTSQPVTPSGHTPPPAPVSVTCRAVEQSELPENSWATTDKQCRKCEVGYKWWPCNTQEPQLCSCTDVDKLPTGAPSVNLEAVPSRSPVNSGSVCVAIPQTDLPDGQWATTDYHCQFCEEGRTWWPCNQEPPLCRCGMVEEYESSD